MISFLYGVLIGIVIGRVIDLYATWYEKRGGK